MYVREIHGEDVKCTEPAQDKVQ